VGGIWHETNTFAPGQTAFDDFRRYQFARGSDLLEIYGDTGTELGGIIRASRELELKVVPLAFAGAVPSGIVTRETFRRILDLLVDEGRRRGPFDSMVLVLHGAMCVEDYSDPESEVVRVLRTIADDVPVGVTLDLHANPTETLAKSVDIVVGYDTYPHVDMAERGAEALRLVSRMMDSGERPNVHLERLPLLTVPQMQDTREEPMRGLVSDLHGLEAEESVWTASLFPGFPYCDVDHLGFSVYVAADTNAKDKAIRLASHVWSCRMDFDAPPLRSPEDAVAAAGVGPCPVVLADVADNVGGGSPGNGTLILRALEHRAGRDGAIVIWDPESIAEVYRSDEEFVTVDVGNRASDALGPLVQISGRVRRYGCVTYRRSGSYMRGQEVDMGRVAVIESKSGAVVITQNRITPFDDDHLRVAGVNPEDRRILVVKSATAWKAAFGRYVARCVFVRTPGYCPGDLTQMTYIHRPSPIYPLERDATW